MKLYMLFLLIVSYHAYAVDNAKMPKNEMEEQRSGRRNSVDDASPKKSSPKKDIIGCLKLMEVGHNCTQVCRFGDNENVVAAHSPRPSEKLKEKAVAVLPPNKSKKSRSPLQNASSSSEEDLETEYK